MSYISLADLAMAEEQFIADLAGRKGRKGAGGPPPPEVVGSDAAPVVLQTQPAWWGSAASTFFPPVPTMSGLGDAFGRLTSSVEYVRPVSGLNEGAFPSSEAHEAGGDDIMSEQMVYEGLTGNDADQVPAKIPTGDGVDAGGQGLDVDVAVTDFELDDGDSGDVLVEPGQRPSPPPQQQQTHPEVPSFRPAAVNGQNGTHRNGAQNGAHRNGNQRNGVVPRNRIAAFENGAPYIQGTGVATSREGAQNNEPGDATGTAPPNPAAFGYGLGQSSPTDVIKQVVQTAGQVGSTAILSRRGLQAPQFQAAPDQQVTAPNQTAPAPTNYTPWIIGFSVLGAIGLGAFLFMRKKPEASTAVTTASNPPRSKKSKVKAKAKAKLKKSRR